MKRAFNWIGGTLALAGVAFVGLSLRGAASEIDLHRFDAGSWSLFAGLAALYGAANILLALAWRDLLAFFRTNISFAFAMRVYGVSQISRYIPGNLFHLASRQVLGLAVGIPGRALVKSAVWELGLIAVAGGMFGALALPLVWQTVTLPLALAGFAALVLATGAALHYAGPPLAHAFGWQVLFLAASGGIFAATLGLAAPAAMDAVALPTILGAYVIAWLAGLLTPGAPAGLGIREFVLLFLCAGKIAEADLLLAIILGRFVTVAGDVAFFACASWIKPWKRSDVRARI